MNKYINQHELIVIAFLLRAFSFLKIFFFSPANIYLFTYLLIESFLVFIAFRASRVEHLKREGIRTVTIVIRSSSVSALLPGRNSSKIDPLERIALIMK